jgi:hypothetical protein
VRLTAKNVKDWQLPSTVKVGIYPLRLVQANRPNINRDFSSTDFGTRGPVEIGTGTNAIAYITGEPAPPQLTVKLEDAPASLRVGWRMLIRPERTQRKLLDNRQVPADFEYVMLNGDEVWDITQAMNNEIVGGRCTLDIKVEDKNHTVEFFIRGKNPKDADAEAYILANVDAEFHSFVLWFLKTETKDVGYRYNQFNARGDYVCKLNFGSPDGWGMGQIDRDGEKGTTTTQEAWDWKANIRSVNLILREKRDAYMRLIGYFRSTFDPKGTKPSLYWSEPPLSNTFENVSFLTKDWSIMMLYNGGGGLPPRKFTGTPTFLCPMQFNEKTGQWTFHDNNEHYAHKIATEVLETTPPRKE